MENLHEWLRICMLASPVLIAALGAVFCARAGFQAWAMAGAAPLGAVCAAGVLAVGGNVWLALLAGAIAGILVFAAHGVGVLILHVDALPWGAGISLLVVAGQSILMPELWLNVSAPFPHPVALGLSALVLTLLTALLLYGTRWGMRLRSTRKAPEMLTTAGISVQGIRLSALLLGGALGGMGGVLWLLVRDGLPRYVGLAALGVAYAGAYTPQGALVCALFYGTGVAIHQGEVSWPFASTWGAEVLPYGILLLTLLGSSLARHRQKRTI